MASLSLVKDDDRTWRRKNARAWVRLITLNVLFAAASLPVTLGVFTLPPIAFAPLILVWIWHPFGVSFSLGHFIRRMLIEPQRWALAGLVFSALSIGSWFLMVARLIY